MLTIQKASVHIFSAQGVMVRWPQRITKIRDVQPVRPLDVSAAGQFVRMSEKYFAYN